MKMTDGQRQVWAARYERVHSDHASGVMAQWHDRRKAGDPDTIPRELGMHIMSEAHRVAVEQANAAVLSLRTLPPEQGQRGAMLREVLGIAEPIRLAIPADWPEPMDYSLPPPGWMFPEGCNDLVHRLPGETILLADSPRIDREAMKVAYPGWGTLSLVPLAQAWREYMEANDPPGYRVAGVGPEVREGGWRVLMGMDPLHWNPREADARAFAWRCSERPRHVLFAVKVGWVLRPPMKAVQVIGWTDAELDAALAYVQAMSAWQDSEPEAPAFWPSA